MITLDNINKYYGDRQVIQNLSLHVNKGDIYGLVGLNGAGKTTIFKTLLGLSHFQSGQISINGRFKSEDLASERQKIGFFIGKNFFDYLSAEDNLRYYCRLKQLDCATEVPRVLQLVGLKGVRAPFKSFSMGMKQRLGIANALLGSPEIIILDEPVNGLDPQGIIDIRQLIKKLNQEQGITFIVSSHILGELEHTATRFGILDQGKIIKEIEQDDLQSLGSIIEIPDNFYASALSLLEVNNIPVLTSGQKKRSLEDYYFDLIGGQHELH
ncbi:ABC transporter ATP-binding protein [Streptococcus ictaluri]|uniref:Bacitracin ABC transporter, ATP-binding protein BcrA n=1 Tax=Streptococcus ictaluri 707-05 TaxID=764299 RepID=G5JZE3_9STRE|nr:ATP-binding cassette domain-containing protein [Streptococcus ictaluri]EHI70902.1 putative bacitracin ABC transporter, ATP-binding protein BcrA [Streptococcus ictaluri 707-05]